MKFAFILAQLLIICLSTSGQTITTFPYHTSFEGVEGTLNENFPAGWSWEDLNTNTVGNSHWQIIKNSTTIDNARTDSTAVHMFANSSQTNNDWLYTPAIAAQSGYDYTLNFWYSVSPIFPSTEKLEVNVGTAQNSTSMITPALWSNTNITNTSYQQASVTFTATTTGEIVFGFHYISDAVQFVLLVDDVTISTNAPAAILENTRPEISIFPNPASQVVHISSEMNMISYSIMNTSGSVIQQKNMTKSNQCTIDCSDWTAGIYFLVAILENGTQMKKRVVVLS